MAKVFVTDVYGFEGPAYQYTGDDGYPAGVLVPNVRAEDVDGRVWYLPNRVEVGTDEEGFQVIRLRFDLPAARDIANRAFRRGFINSEHWVEVEEDNRSLEERWADDAFAEAEARYYG